VATLDGQDRRLTGRCESDFEALCFLKVQVHVDGAIYTSGRYRLGHPEVTLSLRWFPHTSQESRVA